MVGLEVTTAWRMARTLSDVEIREKQVDKWASEPWKSNSQVVVNYCMYIALVNSKGSGNYVLKTFVVFKFQGARSAPEWLVYIYL